MLLYLFIHTLLDMHFISFFFLQLIVYPTDVPQPSAFGAAVSIKPPPKAAAKGPAKQVSEKKASEYAKLEDTMFEL